MIDSPYFKTPQQGVDQKMGQVWDQVRKAKALPPQTVTLESLFPKIDRWSIGFDSIFNNLLETSREKTPTYPPYDITKYKDGTWEVTMAVAGFNKETLDVYVEDNTLVVKSIWSENDVEPESAGEVIHKGIAKRSFKTNFALAEHVEVRNAKLDDGILVISLKTNLPEEKKPKYIEIQ